MKILVAYYSRGGNTKKAAEIIAETLGAQVDEIVDKKTRKGVLGFLRAGYDATRGKTTEIRFTKAPGEYDVVIVGTPVWNGRVTPAVRTYLLKGRDEIRKTAFFVTCVGRPGRSLKQMRGLYGRDVLAEKVMVKREIETGAKDFAVDLMKILENKWGIL